MPNAGRRVPNAKHRRTATPTHRHTDAPPHRRTATPTLRHPATLTLRHPATPTLRRPNAPTHAHPNTLNARTSDARTLIVLPTFTSLPTLHTPTAVQTACCYWYKLWVRACILHRILHSTIFSMNNLVGYGQDVGAMPNNGMFDAEDGGAGEIQDALQMMNLVVDLGIQDLEEEIDDAEEDEEDFYDLHMLNRVGDPLGYENLDDHVQAVLHYIYRGAMRSPAISSHSTRS
ncbi:hypothetical protein RhiJN_12415 [Ceratobasidium sp. AG-Ba]|nr:hypothetical protein RhiJN_12415 [Ceratobasidium sp. AG-Ba]